MADDANSHRSCRIREDGFSRRSTDILWDMSEARGVAADTGTDAAELAWLDALLKGYKSFSGISESIEEAPPSARIAIDQRRRG